MAAAIAPVMTAANKVIDCVTHARGVTAMAADPQGEILATGDGAGYIRIWDALDWRRPLWSRQTDGAIRMLAVHAHRREIAFATQSGRILVWKLAEPAPLTLSGALETNSVLSLEYDSGDPDQLVWTTSSGFCRRAEIPSGRVSDLYAHPHAVSALALGPSCGKFAVADHHRRLLLFDRTSDGGLRFLPDQRRNARSLAFDGAGALLAVGGQDCSVSIWDTHTTARIATLSGHRAPVISLRFRADQQLLASGDAGGEILLWEAATWRPKQRLSIAGSGASSASADFLVFCRQGRTLAAGGTSPHVHLWHGAGE